MAKYKCFFCGKTMSHKNLKKMRCICGARIFFKPREKIIKVKAI